MTTGMQIEVERVAAYKRGAQKYDMTVRNDEPITTNID